MADKPDIVKKLMEEERLGMLESRFKGFHEELEIPKGFPNESKTHLESYPPNILLLTKYTSSNIYLIHYFTLPGNHASFLVYRRLKNQVKPLLEASFFLQPF